MQYGKSEGIRRTQEAARKGFTTQMIRDMWDSLWREPTHLRWSGFQTAGSPETIISWSDVTKVFSIEPVDVEFSFFQYLNRLAYHRFNSKLEIDLSQTIQEGLYVFYFGFDSTTGNQNLLYIHNPSKPTLKDLYVTKTLISFLYYDATNQKALTFGNDCFGSEINPHQQWVNHNTHHGLRNPDGLSVSSMLFNEDGSQDSHARFSISAGSFWHDDFEILRNNDVGGTASIPVLSFSGVNNLPRINSQAGFQILNLGRIAYNQNSQDVVQATNNYYVAYHVFETNDLIAGQQTISVMGQAEYQNLSEAFDQSKNEVNTIYSIAPQNGLCYLGSVIFHSSDNYTNSVKSKIAGFAADDKQQHPPVSIANDSKDFATINEKQEISFNPESFQSGNSSFITVTQTAHGLSVNQAIRHDGTNYVKAKADSSANSNVCGVVKNVIDADNFEFVSEGFLSGNWTAGGEYFLSPSTDGLLITLTDPEVWNIGEVRQFVGFATPAGLKIEIGEGDEISSVSFDSGNISIAIDDDVPVGDETIWYQPTSGMLSILVDFQWVKVGTDGFDGIDGVDGQSAYELWIEQGNVGTEAEFIAALKGAVGDTGESAYEIWIGLGNTGTEQDFIDFLMTGQSAYDIWLAEGNVGTEADFLASLKGDKGDAGSDADCEWADRGSYLAPINSEAISVGKSSGNSATLDVAGDGLFSSTVKATNFILSSERKLKENISPISNLGFVQSIPFHQFNFKDDSEKRTRYGVIVDEVEKANPNLIYTSKDGSKSVAYIDLLISKIAVLEKFINELDDEIYNLKHQR